MHHFLAHRRNRLRSLALLALPLLALACSDAVAPSSAPPSSDGTSSNVTPGSDASTTPTNDGGGTVTSDAGTPAETPMAATTPLVKDKTGRYFVATFDTVKRTDDVIYGNAPDLISGQNVDLKLDIYEPATDTAQTRPALLWIHGGGFKVGSKSGGAPMKVEPWVKRGYVMVSIDYRLWPDNRCQDLQDGQLSAAETALWTQRCNDAIAAAQHDAQAAVRYLRKNAATLRIDAGRIGVHGSSAGAVTSMNVAHNASDPGTSGNPGFDSRVAVSLGFSGCQYDLSRIGAGDAPIIDLHATKDLAVPYSCGKAAVEASIAAGIPAKQLTYDEQSHADATYQNHVAETDEAFTLFAATHLKLFVP